MSCKVFISTFLNQLSQHFTRQCEKNRTTAFTYILNKELEDLDVEIKGISFTKERYAEVILEGEDEAEKIIRDRWEWIISLK